MFSSLMETEFHEDFCSKSQSFFAENRASGAHFIYKPLFQSRL